MVAEQEGAIEEEERLALVDAEEGNKMEQMEEQEEEAAGSDERVVEGDSNDDLSPHQSRTQVWESFELTVSVQFS